MDQRDSSDDWGMAEMVAFAVATTLVATAVLSVAHGQDPALAVGMYPAVGMILLALASGYVAGGIAHGFRS